MRIAYVHVGTHKTGTTSIQTLLGENEEALAAAGLFLPHTGRRHASVAAQHNVAFELCQSYCFVPHGGTFAELLREIAESGASRVCLSSEEFEVLASNRGGMRRLLEGLTSIGFETRIIVYLRPQVDYAESLFAELASNGWNVAFDDFLGALLKRGTFWDSCLDYARLLDAFAETFGRDRIIVRPYRSGKSAESLVNDVLDIVLPPNADRTALRLPARLNGKRTFDAVLATRQRHVAGTVTPLPFEPLDAVNIARMVARFARSNALVRSQYAAAIPPVTIARLAREAQRVIAGSEAIAARRAALRGRAESRTGDARTALI